MKGYLPIIVKYSPIRKLALIPFEKSPDVFYRGFELQFIDGEPYGVGYRVLAYRNDKYVDVYDDMSLNFLENESFNVVENGLNKHIQTRIGNVQLGKQGYNQIISFEFVDIQERKISVHIEEMSKRTSRSMNLLAPIGVGSKVPEYMPVFFMYDFDFIRRRRSVVSCKIDGRKIRIDTFPMPMNGQTRLFARYSNECELLEFANTSVYELQKVELKENNTYCDGNVEYFFDDREALKKVMVHFGEENVQISFDDSLSLDKTCVGQFTINPREQMGYIQGEYSVQRENNTIIFKITPIDGWISKPNSFITRLILGKNSVFCSWSRKYSYEAIIDLATEKVEAYWENGNLK